MVAYRPKSIGSTGYSVRPIVVDGGSGPIISVSTGTVAAGAAKRGTGVWSGAGKSGLRFAHGFIIGGSGPKQFWVALRNALTLLGPLGSGCSRFGPVRLRRAFPIAQDVSRLEVSPRPSFRVGSGCHNRLPAASR